MKKNLKLLLVAVLFIILTVTGCGKNNVSKGSNNTNKGSVKSIDSSRNIKDKYTFSEAVSKFAIKYKESTLIFSTNGENSLDNYMVGSRIAFKFDNSKAKFYSTLLYEYGKKSLADFKKEILDDTLGNYTDFRETLNRYASNTKHKDITIIEENNEYVFASRISEDGREVEYLFGQKVGDYLYFATNSYLSNVSIKENQIYDLLDSYIALFICLTEDDNKTPYLPDMIANIPIVGNKKIVDSNAIYGIGGKSEKSEGFIFFRDNSGNGQYEIYYGAKKMYDSTNWSKNLDNNTKYYEAPAQVLFGVTEDDNYQIFSHKLFMSSSIKSLDEFFEAIKDYVK